MSRPLVVDIDGTMSRADRSIEGRVLDALHAWDAPVVVATGKAAPYPVALCDFIGIEVSVIAENGGVVVTDDAFEVTGDGDAVDRFVRDLREAGHDLGFGAADLANRWRESEVAIARSVPREVLDEIAARHGLEVIDSGFAYHAKSPGFSKGDALETLAIMLDRPPGDFAAVGDSENDVSTFERVGISFAVANADDRARAAADRVTEGAYADGLLEAMAALERSTDP